MVSRYSNIVKYIDRLYDPISRLKIWSLYYITGNQSNQSRYSTTSGILESNTASDVGAASVDNEDSSLNAAENLFEKLQINGDDAKPQIAELASCLQSHDIEKYKMLLKKYMEHHCITDNPESLLTPALKDDDYIIEAVIKYHMVIKTCLSVNDKNKAEIFAKHLDDAITEISYLEQDLFLRNEKCSRPTVKIFEDIIEDLHNMECITNK